MMDLDDVVLSVEEFDEVCELVEYALKVDGFDDCGLGTCECAGRPSVLAYSTDAIVRKLMKRDGMTRVEAREFFDFNIVGAYMGEGTPCFIEGRYNE